MYDTAFSYGQAKDHSTSVIADTTLERFDSEGFSFVLMESIACWKKDETAAGVVQKHVITSNSQRRPRKNYSWIEALTTLEGKIIVIDSS